MPFEKTRVIVDEIKILPSAKLDSQRSLLSKLKGKHSFPLGLLKPGRIFIRKFDRLQAKFYLSF